MEAFFTTSDGAREPNPRYLKAELPALRRIGRAVSRKKKGGSNRRKAVSRLCALHARVANLRHEHHHQNSLKLVRRHGLIAVERPQRQGDVGEPPVGSFDLRRTLKHKAESAGVEVVEVDPKGTSQQCSGCGVMVPKELWVRTHCCGQCGLVLHRDENAAKNILARAPSPDGACGLRLRSMPQEAVCFSWRSRH